MRIRSEVRSMPRSYYALKQMNGAMTAEQREALKQVAPAINLIGSNAGAARGEIADNQATPFVINKDYARNIDVIVGQTARILNKTAGRRIAATATPNAD